MKVRTIPQIIIAIRGAHTSHLIIAQSPSMKEKSQINADQRAPKYPGIKETIWMKPQASSLCTCCQIRSLLRILCCWGPRKPSSIIRPIIVPQIKTKTKKAIYFGGID